jgi:hypothetical protein
MNERVKALMLEAGYAAPEIAGRANKLAELLLRNLAEELADVAKRSKKANPEWANGVDHAAMLAQRMTMALPQWPEAE